MRHCSGSAYFPGHRKGRLTRRRAALLPWLAGAAIAWALVAAPGLGAQASKPTEYQVKAAYLYNFGRFIEWPAKGAAAKRDSFAICVLGRDPFGYVLDATVARETIDGMSVVAKRILRPQEAGDCRILFISSSEEAQLKEILAGVDKTGVLTVSDTPRFSRRGGMVEFVLQDNRVRFEVNLTAAEQAGLTLSSQLLKLAVSVRKSPQPGE